MSRHADEATVRRWFDAFNSRDLKGMLACMHPHVDFHPLRLHGIDASYRGHRGVSAWFAGLRRAASPACRELGQSVSYRRAWGSVPGLSMVP